MGRPLLALGLLAAAALLMGSLFTELEHRIEDPEAFAPDPKALEQGAEAAAAHPDVLKTAAEADLLRLGEDTELTLPPGGAEIDGDLVRLLADTEWTLPAGSDLHDVTLPVPGGTEVTLPNGTRVLGDTLVFPPDSQIVFDDGTVLRLPQGGTLRLPGVERATLLRAVQTGHLTVPPSGGIFAADQVRTAEAWPMTLPAGTTFRVPPEWALTADDLAQGGTYTLPAGHDVDPRAAPPAPQPAEQDGETAQGLLEQIGRFTLKPGEPDTGTDTKGGASGPSLPDAPGRTFWIVLAVLVAAALVGVLLWTRRGRFRARVAGAVGGPAAASPGRHPYRLVATLGERPERLPLAVLPATPARLTLRLERRHTEGDEVRWAPIAAEGTLRLAGETLYAGMIAAEGTSVALPDLRRGDAVLRITLRGAGKKVVLEETLRVAPWDEQVARDYDRLAAAVQRHILLPDGFTPRILEERLVAQVPASGRALARAVTTFERANYSLADIGESEWVTMAVTVERLIRHVEGVRRRAGPQTAARPADAVPTEA